MAEKTIIFGASLNYKGESLHLFTSKGTNEQCLMLNFEFPPNNLFQIVRENYV